MLHYKALRFCKWLIAIPHAKTCRDNNIYIALRFLVIYEPLKLVLGTSWVVPNFGSALQVKVEYMMSKVTHHTIIEN